ncbi:MAG: SUMF1/EgtB/PvdO family nonheme iron enzyme [Candidatus Helarchaeota archaeon]
MNNREKFSRKSNSSKKSHNKMFVRVPGYIINALIHLPKYHPHIIWRLSYLYDLYNGKDILDLIKYPPWPNPPDKFISNLLLYEIIENNDLIIDWTSGKFEISKEYQEKFNKYVENSILNSLNVEVRMARWWMDALWGTVLSYDLALSYDVDYTKKIPSNCEILSPKIKESEIEKFIKANITKLIYFLNIDLLHIDFLFNFKKPEKKFVYLLRPFINKGLKEIQFELYDYTSSGEGFIVPHRLEELEPMLKSELPELFKGQRKIRRKIKRFKPSDIEEFALKLEMLPNKLIYPPNKTNINIILEYLIKKLENKEVWIQWFINGQYIEPIVGNSNLHFQALSEILNGDIEIFSDYDLLKSIEIKTPKFCIITSSFLNASNLEEYMGLANAIANIKNLEEVANILIIYGHSNDDSFEKQIKDINDYTNKLFQLVPNCKNKIIMVPSKKRSHEKIIINSNGTWMVGSWNPTSSQPNSYQYEVSVRGYSPEFSIKLLKYIDENIENPKAKKIIENCKNILINESKNLEKINFTEVANLAYENLNESLNNLKKIVKIIEGDFENISNDVINLYNLSLDAVRICLLPFLKRANISIITQQNSNELFINQIRLSNETLFLASDRISENVLNYSFINDFLLKKSSDKKVLRILWGREFDLKEIIDAETIAQLNNARKAIEKLQKVNDIYLLTNDRPMENHAKFLLVDGVRGLITSENYLSYGGEKDKYESRELGIFIESIPIIRYIEGRSIFHRYKYFKIPYNINIYGNFLYEWVSEGINQYYALQPYFKEMNYDYRQIKYILSAIEMEIDIDQILQEDDEIDEFDKEQIEFKKLCFNELKSKLDNDIGNYLWRLGIEHYLLIPNTINLWIPYNQSINQNTITELNAMIKKLYLKNFKDNKINRANKNPKTNNGKISKLVQMIMKDMVLIKRGSFYMGDDMGPENERPKHKVIITKDFYMSKYPITQKIWRLVMNSIPDMKQKFINDNFPIIYVSYYDVQEFLKILNSLPRGGGFDLPTEAQWEYACRAGTQTTYFFGDDPGYSNQSGELEKYAWTKRNSDNKLHEVGLLKPNPWGLYDILGLVYEHLKDDRRKYKKETVKDPIGPLNTKFICTRGGSWSRFPIDFKRRKEHEHFRCSYRGYHKKDEISYRASFRLIRTIK